MRSMTWLIRYCIDSIVLSNLFYTSYVRNIDRKIPLFVHYYLNSQDEGLCAGDYANDWWRLMADAVCAS